MAYRIKSIVLVLILGSLSFAGCSTPAATTLESPSPTPKASNNDTFQSEIFLANSELEEEFLQIALASCELTKTQSLHLYDSQGVTSISTYFRPSENLLDPENQLSENSVGDFIPGIYNNYLPAFFDPCLLEEQAVLAENPDAELLEHSVEKIGTFRYVWSQHQGGANLESMYYDVRDGFISQYSKEENSAIKTEVSYTEFSGDTANFFIEAYGY